MKPLTFSWFETAANCTATVVYKQYPHTGDDAIAGTEKHEEQEASLDPIDMPGSEREVSYIIDPRQRTVVRVGVAKNRNYGQRPWYSIAGTLDLEHVGDIVTVVDYKSHKRVNSPANNWQLRLQALATNVYYKKPVRAMVHYLNNGEQDVHPFTTFDHLKTWSDIDRVLDSLVDALGNTPRPRSGPWCHYCDAVLQCAAIKSDMMALGESTEKSYHTLKTMKVAYDRGWSELKALVKAQPVLLDSGRLLRMKENSRGSWLLSEEKQ